MEEKIILKYDKNISIRVGALSYKLYVFLLSIFALMILISSAIFDFICYKNGFSDEIIDMYVPKIIYMSLFVAVVWIFNIPVWLPGYFAENSVFVKNGKKLYKIRLKRDSIFDRKEYLDNPEFLDNVVKKLPNDNDNVFIDIYDEYEVLKKKKKFCVILVKYNKNGKQKEKKMKLYNIYTNFNVL